MKVEKVRIGFVGVGGMGQCAHLRNFVTVPDCEVVALAEIKQEQGKLVATRYGVPKAYASHQEMLANEQLDAIVAPQQFSRHGVLISELAAFGLPIMTEKPLAGTIAAGEKILKALAAGKTWQMVGYHKRSDPAVMYAKAEIDRLKKTGELGKLKYVRIIMPAGDWVANGLIGHLSTDEPVPSLEWDAPAADMDEQTNGEYGAFVNYYIHQVNLLRHLMGEPYTMSYADPAGVVLVAHGDSGLPGTIEMSPYLTTVDWHEQALVAFEHGYVKIDIPAPLASNRAGRVEILRDPGNGVVPITEVPTLPWVHAMKQQAINFVSAVKGESKPLCDATEALEDLKVARDYIRLLKGR